MYYNDVCTVPVNIAGLPAISVPCAYSKNNLPISLQIIGNRFDEQKILNTAYSFENILGGFDKLRK
jgi:aspartyl-tRNA(Asn)/glutamyl-tRNA(Gln) amidotransferase subunit A